MRRIGLALLMAVALIALDASAGAGSKEWYLMEPPVDEASNFGYGVLDQAPLNQWKRIATFSTEAACEVKRSDTVQATKEEIVRLSQTSPQQQSWRTRVGMFKGALQESRLAEASTCISADDSRLTPGSTR